MAETAAINNGTTIMYGAIDANGALQVQYYCDNNAILRPSEIIALIKNPPANMPTQKKPFWCNVDGPHRMVYTLTAPNWFFPGKRDMQVMNKVPWRMKSADPEVNFARPQVITENQIYGNKDERIKTIFVDDAFKTPDSMPYVFDLFVDIWNDPNDPHSWITPIVIDPGTNHGGDD